MVKGSQIGHILLTSIQGVCVLGGGSDRVCSDEIVIIPVYGLSPMLIMLLLLIDLAPCLSPYPQLPMRPLLVISSLWELGTDWAVVGFGSSVRLY